MFYAFGSNGSGQLGLGHTEDVSSPQLVSIEGNPAPWTVKQLAAGGNHTVILCDDGGVRVTGNNEDGRCGLKSTKQVTHFFDIELPVDEASGKLIEVVGVAAGWSTTFLLSSTGVVYVCGSGSDGELGLGHGLTQAESLQQIPGLGGPGADVVAITSGMAHTVALLSNGELHGWGKGRRGQLGDSVDAVWQPQVIPGIAFKASQVVCGKDFTIVAGRPDTGDLIVLGAHKDDRFRVAADAPTSVHSWRSIAASWGSGYILESTGDITAWGRNDHGQLPAEDLPKTQALAAGSEHCLALMNNGQVAAWGWGEHGNCGTPLDARGDVKAAYNTIEVLHPNG
ncbi:regulator of chromosome condensation 1/beta-lactamase-inhibitor protein II [Neohortaea acidophila]|uniref:Regulator of chromosome condensation 1/beta-lactamase-inhibitor protein II n=1 Tax=Neohortaea acidophila TaxID=245834 RepID=A0A6A6Q8Z0_9PEZI|nr:regulator of chromosome condensation 1/beta-lactamase-inhibitor protein II [Neohortaea acidophila]KAF2487847.1 regulator of chromosome condensation 1/beta-lactamase-inhibitor protein II [Neohortaea acidophila]